MLETPPAAGNPCGTRPIAIARMQWPSAALLAEIHARILKAQFNCQVQVLPGDLAATGSSMGSTGQPAVAPEMWVARIADIWNPAIKGQKVRPAAPTYTDTVFEGWFIPDYVASANASLASAASLRDHAQLFSVNGQKPKFISCPPDWACAVINRNLLRANGLDGLFEVVEPANRFELDNLIGQAVSRKEPILFYYWQPNPVLAQFPFKPLDLGAYDKDAFACLGRRECAEPKPSSFPSEPVITALAEWVFTEAPDIAAYFQKAQLPLAEMNTLLFQLNEQGASVESVADRFIAERRELWQGWTGAPSLAPVTQ